MLQYILMGAQAAGAIGGQYMSYRASRRAFDLEQQQIGLRLQQEVVASNQQSLFNLRQLEETLASQRALAAARGVSIGQGTARTMQASSIREFGKDEQARKMSLEFLKTQRMSQIGSSKIGQYGARAKFGLSAMQTMLGVASTFGMGGGGLLTGMDVNGK